MQVFPTTPAPSYPLGITPLWKTLTNGFEGGGEQRRQLWLFPKYDVSLQYDVLTLTSIDLLWAFYMARKGSFEAFLFFDLHVSSHKEVYVVTADGTTDIYDIPGKSTSSRTLYVNGSEVTTGFSYLTGGGDGAADRIDFTSAPTLGDIITIDFTGYLRIKCRFEEDKMSKENFTVNLFRTGIKLKGVK